MFYAVYNNEAKAKAADSDLEETVYLLEASGPVTVKSFETEEARDIFYFNRI